MVEKRPYLKVEIRSGTRVSTSARAMASSKPDYENVKPKLHVLAEPSHMQLRVKLLCTRVLTWCRGARTRTLIPHFSSARAPGPKP